MKETGSFSRYVEICAGWLFAGGILVTLLAFVIPWDRVEILARGFALVVVLVGWLLYRRAARYGSP